MGFAIGFVIGLVIGYLDPVVLFRKCSTFLETNVFPFVVSKRNEWRGKNENNNDTKPTE